MKFYNNIKISPLREDYVMRYIAELDWIVNLFLTVENAQFLFFNAII